MDKPRYILEKGSKKHLCPDCGKKRFVRFIDTTTGEYLPEEYGRCDRESNCSYFQLPPIETRCFFVQFDEIKEVSKQAVLIEQVDKRQLVPKSVIFEQLNEGCYIAEYFIKDVKNKSKKPFALPYSESNYKYYSDNNLTFASAPETKQRNKATPHSPPEPAFFQFETFKETLQPDRYEENTFIQNLFSIVQFPFEVDDMTSIIKLYRLGTVANGYRAGAITFPFIDAMGNVRAVQVKQFDKENHTIGTDFLHSIIEKHHTRNNQPLPEWLEAYNKNDKKVSCLFGEHLLNKYPSNPVALVEAPKTAVYGTLYFGLPETPNNFLWLAVYNKSSFSFEKIKVLQGRFVYVFPDLSKDGNTFKEWETKAKEYERSLPGTRFIFSDLLEQLAPDQDKIEGSDIADYLIKQDWRLFRKRNIQEQPPHPEPEKVSEVTTLEDFIFSDITALSKTEFKKHEQENKAPIQDNPELFAWLNSEGKLIIPNPMTNKYVSVYPSIRHYNERLCLPDVVDQSFSQLGELNKVQIDLNLLTINH